MATKAGEIRHPSSFAFQPASVGSLHSEMNTEATELVLSITAGDRSQADRLMELVYEDLHGIAELFFRGERADHTLQPTALVHEAYLRLVDQNKVDWRGRTHFLAAGAKTMRRVLIDHAKRRGRTKRGGGRCRMTLDEEFFPAAERELDALALEEALRRLEAVDPEQATIVELRFYGGLSVEEVAEVLHMSKRTVERHWTMIRAWLRLELDRE